MQNKISTRNKKNFCKTKTNSESDEEMLQIAFDINEELNLPENYTIDEINQESLNFLRQVRNERKKLEIPHEKFNSIDFEFSLNVNNHLIFEDVYDKLQIDNIWIEIIKQEFNKLREQMASFGKEKNSFFYKNVGELIKEYNLYAEKLNYAQIPNDEILKTLCPKLSNKLCIKLINHFDKIFSQTSPYLDKILIWVYYLMANLEFPLIDEDNSVLYLLNKKLLKFLKDKNEDTKITSNASIAERIIFIIISEVFGQKVANTNSVLVNNK
jgi:hypothetical protein